MKREVYKSLRTISHADPLGPGGPLCAGCGGQLTVRLFHKALGDNVVFVNGASCSTLLATYPYTPLSSSWLYTAMACAPAGAQGVRDAGFMTQVQPAAIAGAILCAARFSGKLNGLINEHGPIGTRLYMPR